MPERKPLFLSFRPKGEILNACIFSTIRFLALLEMTVLVSFRSDTSYNMWNLQISPFGQNDNTGGSNEKYGIFVQTLFIWLVCLLSHI